jgi:hypothetical protein
MSQTKYLYMTKCVDSLQALVQERIRILKTNKYLANADWFFIEKNFHIENPHSAITRNNDRRDVTLLNQIEHDDLFEEVRIRMINIQKVRFLYD